MDVKIKNLGEFKVLRSEYEIFMGLRFKKKLNKKKGIIIELSEESKNKLIADMLFVFFKLDMAFLDSSKKIIDIRRNVKPFISFIIPKEKAKYLIEMNAGEMKNLEIGDKFEF